MQQPNRPFWRRRTGFVARTNHQRTEIQIVAIPGFIDWNSEVQTIRRHVYFLPPQRSFAGFYHRITFASRGGGNMQLHGIARTIAGFIQFQGHTIGANRAAAVAIILPAITRPEAHAAHRIIRRFYFQTIGAPLNREAHFTGFIGLKIQSLLTFDQIFLIKLRLPPLAFSPVPVIITTFADQTHLQAGHRFFIALRIGINDIESSIAVFIDDRLIHRGVSAIIINSFRRKLRSNPRQRIRRPDGLFNPTRHRAATRLQQAGLQHHL